MSKTQATITSSSLAAAFTATPSKKATCTATKNNNNNTKDNFLRHVSSESECASSYQGSECGDSHNKVVVSTSPYATFTSQDIQGPTFISVFSSLKDILPHHNNSAKGQVPWRCSNCDSSAYGHKCPGCNRSRDSAALRVFMGQLTKEGDVSLIQKMLEVLCPELPVETSLLHIEPHTHANTGRGKGCAWVYVSSLNEVMYVVSRLHKRTYPTINAETGEVGFVAFPDSVSQDEIKAAFDNDITFLSDNVVQLFHRSPITAEVPLSLQRTLMNNNNNKNHQNTNKQQSHHHYPRQQVQQQAPAAAVRTMMKVGAYTSPSAASQQQQKENIIINNTNMMNQDKQQQEIVAVVETQHQQAPTPNTNTNNASSSHKRYRWNPYSFTASRVMVA